MFSRRLPRKPDAGRIRPRRCVLRPTRFGRPRALPVRWPINPVRTHLGSVSLCVNSSSTQEQPLTQQIKFCSSIHLSLDALELIDFALRLSVAMLRSLCRSNSIKVSEDSRRETLEFLDATGFGFL